MSLHCTINWSSPLSSSINIMLRRSTSSCWYMDSIFLPPGFSICFMISNQNTSCYLIHLSNNSLTYGSHRLNCFTFIKYHLCRRMGNPSHYQILNPLNNRLQNCLTSQRYPMQTLKLLTSKTRKMLIHSLYHHLLGQGSQLPPSILCIQQM